MALNLITEPVSQGNYYSEYIEHILRYKDQTRKGGYVRYYNIDRELTNTTTTKSILHTRDHHFNVYEYTPTWGIDEITDTAETSDVGKLKFTADASITVYTIEHPTIHDLVAFVYPPYTSNHVFRVKGMNTVIRERDAGLKTFKLELEYAFDVDLLDNIKISTNFVYSTFDGAYLPLTEYTKIMRERKIIQSTLDAIQPMFDNYSELFITGVVSDLYVNSQIFQQLTRNRTIQQYFQSKVPYGVTSYLPISANQGLDISTNKQSVIISIPPSSTKIEDYVFNSTTALSDVVDMFFKFSG